MKGTPAIYLGRIINKENFRAFIYGPNGQRRLVESWDEFEANMQSGVWFATQEEANESISPSKEEEPVQADEKPKSNRKPRPKPTAKPKPVAVEEVEEVDNVIEDDDTVFEVTDDFLPKEGE